MSQVATQNSNQKPASVVVTAEKKQGLIEVMAAQYNMDPVQFSNAVKKTAMPGNATNEEFAAFMMVAHQYKLNPFLRELYAFPKKGGGIVPMVSIDGWVNLINSHPLLAGFELETHFDDKQKLAAVTCRIYRKDRSLPIVVTEYMIECFRNTEPWRQMPSRMLRHKALIQAARYAFGLSGIYDEDEAKDISGIKDITPSPRPERKDFIIPVQNNPQGYGDDNTPQQEQGNAAAEPAEQVDEDGVVTTAEYGPPEAYSDGESARFAGKAKTEIPVHVKSFPHLQEAWEQGYDSGAEG